MSLTLRKLTSEELESLPGLQNEFKASLGDFVRVCPQIKSLKGERGRNGLINIIALHL